MANFTKTTTNGLTIFGGERASLWGSAVLGTDYWGYGSLDLITTVYKLFSETLALNDQTTPAAEFVRTFAASLAVSGDQASQMLIDQAGYKFIFGISENAENRPNTSYNNVVVTGTVYTSVTASTQTSWTSV